MKINARNISFAIIIIICIFAINFGVYWQFFRDRKEEKNEVVVDHEQEDLARQF